MFETLAILALFAAPTEEWPVLWPTVPPVIQSETSPFDELKSATAEKEHAAPIPDSLVGYDVHELTDADGNVKRILLEKPVAGAELTRLDGPTAHSLSGCNCRMCLANHMIQSHGQTDTYLRSVTCDRWPTFHDNLHNDPATAKVRKQGSGYIGYGETGGYSGRPGLVQRLVQRLSGRQRR